MFDFFKKGQQNWAAVMERKAEKASLHAVYDNDEFDVQ